MRKPAVPEAGRVGAQGERATGPGCLGGGRAQPGLGAASVTDVMARRTYLINQHKHESIFVIDQVLNLLEHLGYELAALETKDSFGVGLHSSRCLMFTRTHGPHLATVRAHGLLTPPGTDP